MRAGWKGKFNRTWIYKFASGYIEAGRSVMGASCGKTVQMDVWLWWDRKEKIKIYWISWSYEAELIEIWLANILWLHYTAPEWPKRVKIFFPDLSRKIAFKWKNDVFLILWYENSRNTRLWCCLPYCRKYLVLKTCTLLDKNYVKIEFKENV